LDVRAFRKFILLCPQHVPILLKFFACSACLMHNKIRANETQKKAFLYLRKDSPSISRAAPATSNANLWLVVVAPGKSWTRPTTSTTAPNNRHTTTACSPDICGQRSSSGDKHSLFSPCLYYILYIQYSIQISKQISKISKRQTNNIKLERVTENFPSCASRPPHATYVTVKPISDCVLKIEDYED